MHVCTETLQLDSTDFGSYYELYLLYLTLGDEKQAEVVKNELTRLMEDTIHNYIRLASDYWECGLYEESIAILHFIVEDAHSNVYPMLHYFLGYFYEKMGYLDIAQMHRQAGSIARSEYCFPNTTSDLIVLQHAVVANPGDAKAHYYLGNWLYDKKRYSDAVHHWESSREADDTFATVHRNLALAYYNTSHEPERALLSLEKAFACNPTDARVCYELDQLYKKLGYLPSKRLTFLENHLELVGARDDLYLEYITLLNTQKHFEDARILLAQRLFHPWEGGEGKVTGQYALAHVELGKQYLNTQREQEAIALFEQAMMYPENLGEGKLVGVQENNIHYYMGCAYAQLGLHEKATTHFRIASHGPEEPVNALYYNDQPPDMIFYQGLAWLKLGDVQEAQHRFAALIKYGEQHLDDSVQIDYFAVSLPDFLVFEDDLNKRNKIHCHYMMGLGKLGFQEMEKARTQFTEVLQLDPNHQGALIHSSLF